jgi:hypothetical protein
VLVVSGLGADAQDRRVARIASGFGADCSTMSATSRKPPLSPERRSALGILGDAPRGLTEAMLMAYGFRTDLIADLVRDGLATMRSESVQAGGRRIDVRRVRITNAGRRAIEG